MNKKLKALLYCTKAKPTLYNVLGKYIITEYMGKDFMQNGIKDPKLNGKIVAECDFEVEKINVLDCTFRTTNLVEKEILDKSCLTYHELFEYLKNRLNPRGYAIHIKNLHIFDEPKELSDYDDIWSIPLKKAPQNMMYAFELVSIKEEFKFNEYILISIQPQWLCKILNGEKTIEVRKKVLKEMLKNK